MGAVVWYRTLLIEWPNEDITSFFLHSRRAYASLLQRHTPRASQMPRYVTRMTKGLQLPGCQSPLAFKTRVKGCDCDHETITSLAVAACYGCDAMLRAGS